MPKGNTPDYRVVAPRDDQRNAPLVEVGAAWANNGDSKSISVRIDRMPITFTGELVLFPRDDDNTATTKKA